MGASRPLLRFAALFAIVAIGTFVWSTLDTAPPEPESGTAAPAQKLPPHDETKPVAISTVVESESATRGTPASTTRCRLRGRVIDSRRRPVAEVDVAFFDTGTPQAVAKSNEFGEFSIPLSVLPSVASNSQWDPARPHLRANKLDQTALADCPAIDPGEPSPDLDVGTLVLMQSVTVTVRVLENGQPASGARVSLDWGPVRSQRFESMTDERGRAALEGVPVGFAMLTAWHGSSCARLRAFLPDENDLTIELEPTNSYDVIVVDSVTKAPIAGAELSLTELFGVPSTDDPDNFVFGDSYAIAPIPNSTEFSDANGLVHFGALPQSGAFEVVATAQGYAPSPARGSGGLRLAKSDVPQRLELIPQPQRTVRFPIVAGDLPVPAVGTPLTIRFAPGSRHDDSARPLESKTAMGASEIVLRVADENGLLLARTPDGAMARLYYGPDTSTAEPTSFFASRSIRVAVKDSLGQPVSGVYAQAMNQGNNPMLEFRDGILTDALGVALLEGLPAELVNIAIRRASDRWFGESSHAVDLAAGDGDIEIRLPAVARFGVRFRLDGECRIPEKYRVRSRFGFCRVVTEDPDAGVVTFEMNIETKDLGVPRSFTANTQGYLPVQFEVIPTVTGTPNTVEVQPTPAAHLDVHVLRSRTTRVAIELEVLDPTSQAFGPRSSFRGQTMSIPNGPRGSFRFPSLAAGTYRAIDRQSNAASQPIFVEAGGAARVELPIGEQKRLRGRVVGPSDGELDLARVRIEEPGIARSTSASREGVDGGVTRVQADGSFEIAVPATRGVMLVVDHPWLSPAESDGRYDTTNHVDDSVEVVLRLVEGQELRIPRGNYTGQSNWFAPIRLGILQPGTEEEPTRWFDLTLIGGEFRIGGIAPGKTDLVLDVRQQFAPLVLRNVEIVVGRTTLDPPTFVRRSAVLVRILTAPGHDAPRIYVHATRLDGFRYSRDINSNGESTVILPGLAAGRFKLSTHCIHDDGKRLETEITLDGTNDATIDFDLR